jgi:hypothetical protein
MSRYFSVVGQSIDWSFRFISGIALTSLTDKQLKPNKQAEVQ